MGREMQFGAFLRHWREQRGMKLDTAAKAVGVSISTWNHWETGRRQPHLDNLFNVAQLLNIPPQCFICTKHSECIVVRTTPGADGTTDGASATCGCR